MAIGQPNDVYEQEADRVAEQVMGMSSAAFPTVQRQVEEEEPEELQTKPLAETITPLVQRQEMLEEEEPIQAKCEDCEAEEPIQRFADGTAQAQPDLENRLNASQGGGSALPNDVRSFMEPRFGADFSQVRVHTGSDAVQMNQELNAQAFAHGQDVYFGAGKAPAKDALTAHELTHVVQQSGDAHAKQINELQGVQRKGHHIHNIQVTSAESHIQRESPQDKGSESSQVNIQDWEKIIPDMPEGQKIKIVPASKGGEPTTQVMDSKGKPIDDDPKKNSEENEEQKKVKDFCGKIAANRANIHDRLLSLAANKVGYMYTTQQDKPTGAAKEYSSWVNSAKPEQVGKDPQGRVKLQWELWQDLGNEEDPSGASHFCKNTQCPSG